MGVYLSAPVTEKESINNECPAQGFNYGASSMQGWRVTQEDAHNCIPVFHEDTQASFFAVYDGHGGSEVAKYCELHFPNFVKAIIENLGEKEKRSTQYMQSAFLAFDATLTTEDVIKELKALSGKGDIDNEDDEYEDDVGRTETDLLKEEAGMPLDKVLAQYNEDQAAPQTDAATSAGSSSSSGAGASGSGGQGAAKISANEENTSKKASNVENMSKAASLQGGGSSSTGRAAVASNGVGAASSGGSSAAKTDPPDSSSGVRPSKVKATVDISKETTNDDSDDDDDDDDDEEEEEDEWEDMSDDDDDDDEDDIEDDKDVPMMDHSDEEPGSDSGCTACVLLKQGSRLVVANAGDSRCVLARAGTAVELSFDHKPEDEPERSRIEASGGKVTADGRVNGGLNLSRAIGDHVYKRNVDVAAKDQMITALPDIHTEELCEDDQFIVIACDGIWNSMSSQEVVEFVEERLQDPEKRKKPALVCEELFDHCLAANNYGDGTGCDNMTCIIIVLDTFESATAKIEKSPAATKINGDDKSVHTGDKGGSDSTKDKSQANCKDEDEKIDVTKKESQNSESSDASKAEDEKVSSKRCAEEVEVSEGKRLKV